MRVFSLSAIAVTVSASCARRCGTNCRVEPVAKQFFYPQQQLYPQQQQFLYPQQYPYQQQYPYPQQQYYQQPYYPAPVYPPYYPPASNSPLYPYPLYPGALVGCAGTAGTCSCDNLCTAYDDCCSDYGPLCTDNVATTLPFGSLTLGDECGSDKVSSTDLGACEVGLQCTCEGTCLDTALTVNSVCRTSNCDVSCNATFEPICGTDGYQYTNQCIFDIALCQYPTLEVAFVGECVTTTTPALTCASFTDCASCAAIFDCAWDLNSLCVENVGGQLPPPWVSFPAACPIDPVQCTLESDCTNCTNVNGCIWSPQNAQCYFSTIQVQGYISFPNQCPIDPVVCTVNTDCDNCTNTAGCIWSPGVFQTPQGCVNSQFPVNGFYNYPQQCPSNQCVGQTDCTDCTTMAGCIWSINIAPQFGPNNQCYQSPFAFAGPYQGYAWVNGQCAP